jgi:predicted secreted protein
MRRPKVLFLLALPVLLAACSDDYSGGGGTDYGGDREGETVTLTVDEPEAEVRVGDTVELRLDENASVGDDWQVTSEPSADVLELTDEDVESEGDCDGCGGTKVLTYEVVGEGATSIELHNCYRCDTDGNSTEEPPAPADLAFSVNAR